MHFAVFVDRDIFAEYETLLSEVKSEVVGRIRITERPAAAPMNEMTVPLILVRPQSRDSARVSVLPPKFLVDVVVRIKRCDNDISEPAITFGVTMLARKLAAAV